MNVLPSGDKNTFVDKRKRAVKVVTKSFAQNRQNTKVSTDILALQQKTVRDLFYGTNKPLDEPPDWALRAVQKRFIQVVAQFHFRDLPGMRTDWYLLAVKSESTKDKSYTGK
jgi:hypothetical protein